MRTCPECHQHTLVRDEKLFTYGEVERVTRTCHACDYRDHLTCWGLDDDRSTVDSVERGIAEDALKRGEDSYRLTRSGRRAVVWEGAVTIDPIEMFHPSRRLE